MNTIRKLIIFSFCILFMSINISCEDTEDMEDQVNCVKYKVHNNNPIAHMSIWDGGDTPVIAINDYETTFYTKSYSTELIITCKEDKKATITIQLFVNNKFIREVSGTTPVELHYRLK